MGNHKYRKAIEIAKKNNKVEELNTIMDDYFDELEEYHPQIYSNLMKEIYKLGVKTNISDEEELNGYLKYMKHKDMPPLWSVEQTTKSGKDIGIDFDKWSYNTFTFNYVMNMMRTDYHAEFKRMFASSPLMKQTIVDSPNFYAHMAKAWLDDEDAPKDKAIKYIHLVINDDCDDEEV